MHQPPFGGRGPPPGQHFMMVPPHHMRPALGMPPPPAPQPPSFFPGAASLFEQLDRLVLVVLRDGRHLVGIMRSYDQFSNIVLEDTHERHFVGNLYGDIPLGLYIVRGESVVLLGELDEEEEQEEGTEAATTAADTTAAAAAAADGTAKSTLRKVSTQEILQAQQESGSDDNKLQWEFES
jgi:U6 snRNA-associated Sm-like protein LSm1